MGFLTTKDFQGLYADTSPTLPDGYFDIQKAKQITTNNFLKFTIQPKIQHTIDELRDAIGKTETEEYIGNDEKAYSFKRFSGSKEQGMALGKYQVTEGELRTYGPRYLGRVISSQEFLDNWAFQDAYMENKLQYWREKGVDDDNLIVNHRGGLNVKVSDYKNYLNKVLSYMPAGFGTLVTDVSEPSRVAAPQASLKKEMSDPSAGFLKMLYKSFPVQLAKTTLEAAVAPLEVISYPVEEITRKISPEKKYIPQLAGFAATLFVPGPGEIKGLGKVTELEKTVVEVTNLISGSIKKIKPIRAAMEEAYSAERAIRFPMAEEVYEKAGGGIEGISAALAAMKGPLLTAEQKAEMAFEPLGKLLSSAKKKVLADAIWKYPLFDVGEKLGTSSGLLKILEGQVPQVAELAKLEDVFGSELVKTILSAQQFGWGQIALRVVGEVMDMARSIITSGDLSAFLKQGALYTIKHPIKAVASLKQSVIEAFSPKIYSEWFTNVLAKDPVYPVIKETGLEITRAGKVAALGEREEMFRGTFISRIPILGPIIGASERAYSGFLNKARVDLFKDGLKILEKGGYSAVSKTDKLIFKALAEMTNAFTGRGKLGELEKNMRILNKAFFAPRYLGSRLLQILNPVWYIKLPKPVRMMALKNLGEMMGFWVAEAVVAKAGGFEVELNPLSSDWLKTKWGDSRWDLSFGLQPYLRTYAQVVWGQRKSLETGEIRELAKIFGGRLGAIGGFFRQKLAPGPGVIADILSGSTVTGEDVTLSKELMDNFTFMWVQDVVDAWYQWGSLGLLTIAPPSIVGVTTQTFKTKWRQRIDKLNKRIEDIEGESKGKEDYPPYAPRPIPPLY